MSEEFNLIWRKYKYRKHLLSGMSVSSLWRRRQLCLTLPCNSCRHRRAKTCSSRGDPRLCRWSCLISRLCGETRPVCGRRRSVFELRCRLVHFGRRHCISKCVRWQRGKEKHSGRESGRGRGRGVPVCEPGRQLHASPVLRLADVMEISIRHGAAGNNQQWRPELTPISHAALARRDHSAHTQYAHCVPRFVSCRLAAKTPAVNMDKSTMYV